MCGALYRVRRKVVLLLLSFPLVSFCRQQDLVGESTVFCFFGSLLHAYFFLSSETIICYRPANLLTRLLLPCTLLSSRLCYLSCVCVFCFLSPASIDSGVLQVSCTHDVWGLISFALLVNTDPAFIMLAPVYFSGHPFFCVCFFVLSRSQRLPLLYVILLFSPYQAGSVGVCMLCISHPSLPSSPPKFLYRSLPLFCSSTCTVVIVPSAHYSHLLRF